MFGSLLQSTDALSLRGALALLGLEYAGRVTLRKLSLSAAAAFLVGRSGGPVHMHYENELRTSTCAFARQLDTTHFWRSELASTPVFLPIPAGLRVIAVARRARAGNISDVNSDKRFPFLRVSLLTVFCLVPLANPCCDDRSTEKKSDPN